LFDRCRHALTEEDLGPLDSWHSDTEDLGIFDIWTPRAGDWSEKGRGIASVRSVD
jgi:hypothetical protein